MGKDLETTDANADLQPLTGPMPYTGNSSYQSDTPGWMEAVPPYGPTDGLLDRINRYWSWIIRWPRYIALGFLYVTYSFWIFVFVVGTVTLLIVALTSAK